MLLLWGLAASASASRRWLFQSGNSSVGAQDYPSPALADYFVQIIDGEFALGCNKFPISGYEIDGPSRNPVGCICCFAHTTRLNEKSFGLLAILLCIPYTSSSWHSILLLDRALDSASPLTLLYRFNAWEVLEAGSGASAFSGSILKQGASATEVLLSVLDIAARNGFTVMRAWAHGVTDAYATVTSSGDAIDGVLKGLDFALAEARKRGLKVSAKQEA